MAFVQVVIQLMLNYELLPNNSGSLDNGIDTRGDSANTFTSYNNCIAVIHWITGFVQMVIQLLHSLSNNCIAVIHWITGFVQMVIQLYTTFTLQ